MGTQELEEVVFHPLARFGSGEQFGDLAVELFCIRHAQCKEIPA